MSVIDEKKKVYSVSTHFLCPIPLRERLDMLAAKTGKSLSELIQTAVEQMYFSGAPAVIEPPAKGE